MKRLAVGDMVAIKLPWSEVCLHMQVADRVRNVLVLSDGAQILNDDGTVFSSPVTYGEAGIFKDAEGLYTYPAVEALPCGCVPHETRMRDNSLGQALWCETEGQAYCNFECPHGDADED